MKQLQREIIAELGVQPEINPAEEIENRVAFLSGLLGESGIRGFVLGISGGQDSLLAGMLAQKAVDKLVSKAVKTFIDVHHCYEQAEHVLV